MSDKLDSGEQMEERDNEFLTIPIRRTDMGNFITSLLGQPQSIEREVYGYFDIDHRWFLHLHQLILQRITQQNEGQLISFAADIGYNNDSSRRINSIDEFTTYNEILRITTKSVKLSWLYLVKFPGKTLPEKQQITFSISRKLEEEKHNPFLSSNNYQGVIKYSITYTERTWGDDLDNIINSEVDRVLIIKKRFEKILDIFVILIMYLWLFGSIMFPVILRTDLESDHKTSLVQEALKKPILNIDEKIDILLQLHSTNRLSFVTDLVLTFLSMLSGILMMFICIAIIARSRPCFIILTDNDKNRKKFMLERKRIKNLLKIIGFLVTIASGIIANYIYFKLNIK